MRFPWVPTTRTFSDIQESTFESTFATIGLYPLDSFQSPCNNFFQPFDVNSHYSTLRHDWQVFRCFHTGNTHLRACLNNWSQSEFGLVKNVFSDCVVASSTPSRSLWDSIAVIFHSLDPSLSRYLSHSLFSRLISVDPTLGLGFTELWRFYTPSGSLWDFYRVPYPVT